MQKNSYTEVTGIIHVPEKRIFMSVGWDKKITAFKDDPDVSCMTILQVNAIHSSIMATAGLCCRSQ